MLAKPSQKLIVPIVRGISLIDNIVKPGIRQVKDPLSGGQVDPAGMLGTAVGIPDCTVEQV
jgi:hypothetical protein